MNYFFPWELSKEEAEDRKKPHSKRKRSKSFEIIKLCMITAWRANTPSNEDIKIEMLSVRLCVCVSVRCFVWMVVAWFCWCWWLNLKIIIFCTLEVNIKIGYLPKRKRRRKNAAQTLSFGAATLKIEITHIVVAEIPESGMGRRLMGLDLRVVSPWPNGNGK